MALAAQGDQQVMVGDRILGYLPGQSGFGLRRGTSSPRSSETNVFIVDWKDREELIRPSFAP